MTEPAAGRTFTFISCCPPYGGNRPQLCLEAALAGAVFEQQVNYVFMDDGVFQLCPGQDADRIGGKALGKIMETLSLYGIEKVLVDAASLRSRGLDAEGLVLPVRPVDSAAIAELIEASDCVFVL